MRSTYYHVDTKNIVPSESEGKGLNSRRHFHRSGLDINIDIYLTPLIVFTLLPHLSQLVLSAQTPAAASVEPPEKVGLVEGCMFIHSKTVTGFGVWSHPYPPSSSSCKMSK